MRLSLSARLVWLALGLFVIVQVPTFLAVYLTLRQAAVTQARTRLQDGGGTVRRALAARGDQLLSRVAVIASDTGFLRVLSSGVSSAVAPALVARAQRAAADSAALYDDSGRLVAASGPAAAGLGGGRGDPGVHLVLVGREPFQVVTVPLQAAGRRWRLSMGFRVGAAVVRRLRGLTGLRVSLLQQGRGPAHAGTVAAGLALSPRQLAAVRSGPGRVRRVDVGGRDFLLLWMPLDHQRPVQVGAALAYPLSQALAPFRRLNGTLVIIVLLSIGASFVGAMWLGRSVSRPVVHLVGAAHRIESGDYQTDVGERRGDELGELAAAFDSMQRGIARRERQIAHQAFHDGLTGLPNRAGLQDHLEQAIRRARGSGRLMALLMIDVDRFKEINDTLGHDLGDRVLLEAGRRLREGLHQGELAARFGGDEFVVVIEDLTSTEAARERAMALGENLAGGIPIDDMEMHLDVSTGVALYPLHGDTAGDLLRRADIAMYDAKQSLQSVGMYAVGRDAEHLFRLSLVHDLRRAVPRGQMRLAYQPKLDVRERGVRTVEALLRWEHPRHGRISPEIFIPLAEQTGTVRALTEWALSAVVGQLRQWRERGIEVGIALNISAVDLASGELPQLLQRELGRSGVPPQCLTLEVTETAVMRDAVRSLQTLAALRDCGVRLAIDDFGTGYSSLSYLKRMPVHELKIDRSFVTGMADDEDDAVIVRSTIDLAHTMALAVVAEGVEDDSTLELLAAAGCDAAQGFGICAPLPPVELERWLRQRRTPDPQPQGERA